MRKRSLDLHGVGLAALAAGLLLLAAGDCGAATDVKVGFTLRTTDASGSPVTQQRSYFVYRPDNLPKDTPAAMVLNMGNKPATWLHDAADKFGFVVVSCQINGHTTPSRDGFDDIDYATAVIDRVGKDENCSDAFMCGLSKGGHMTAAYACEQPKKLRAAAILDEFMGLTTNIPKGPVPIIAFHCIGDTVVPYTKVKDTVDAWRAENGLLGVTPTTFYFHGRNPGDLTQANWEGPAPVAFVTIGGGGHGWQPVEPDIMFAFFNRFRTSIAAAPQITALPVDNAQQVGQPATFVVAAVGDAPLSYQWQKNGTDIPGATSFWYTTPPAAQGDDGAAYSVVVSNKAGRATSDRATLKVTAAPKGPTIAVQPKDAAAVAGRPVAFTVSANGSALTYQWQKNGMDIPGANDAAYKMAAAITPDCGATFRVIVSDGSGRITSIPATLTVTPAPGAPVIVTNPERVYVLPGGQGVFTVEAKSDTQMTYQWQTSGKGMPMVDIPGATSATYTTPVVKEGDESALMRCIVTNAAGNATSATEILAVVKPGSRQAAVKMPALAKPAGTKPAEAQPPEAKPVEAKPPQAKPAGAAQSFTGTVESTGTQKRPRLVVGNTHYELQAVGGADAGVQTTLDQISRGEATGRYVVNGTATKINGRNGIAVTSISKE
jgi:poly(3-hydroxybutyrate) depolymerase